MAGITQKKALIIEDEPDLALIYRSLLEPEGFSVREAHTGLEGLLALGDEKVDLVVLDLNLPKVSGAEILKELPGLINHNTAILVVSGFLDDEVRETFSGLSNVKFFEKPFLAEEFLKLVV